jgi:hypothetical protein
LIKTDLEAQIELGVSYPFPPLKDGECLVTTEAEKTQEIKVGDQIFVGVWTAETLDTIGQRYNIEAKKNGWDLFPKQ